MVDSLQSSRGNLSKEFVFIDDGSKDGSVKALQKCAASLPRSVIIKQQHGGSSVLINKAMNLAHGKYIHFVDGCDVIDPNASALMMKACKDLGVEVAYGLAGNFNSELKDCEQHKAESKVYRFIESPIGAILLDQDNYIRNIGGSGTMVSKALLERIEGADTSIFVHDVSLALRCAKFSKFALVPKTVVYKQKVEKEKIDKDYKAYNVLQAIYNFFSTNKEIAEQYKPELYKALHITLRMIGKRRVVNAIKSLIPKYAVKKMDVNKIIGLYKASIDKLI